MYVAVAIAAFFIMGHVDYARLLARSTWHNPLVWLMGLAVLTCVIVLIPGVGIEVNGARRWLPLGIRRVRLQPSELAKWATVLFLAWWLTYRPVDVRRFFRGFLPTLVPIGIVCVLVVIHDLGTAALIGLFALLMMVVGGIKWWHLVMMVPPVVPAGLWFILDDRYSYRLARVVAFLDPWASPREEGYHMIQSILSFSSGGIFGRGLGNGIQKLGYLPEDTTDFIFAVICEELGLFGALLTVALYLGIIFVAWQVMKQKRDSFGRMLAFGIGAMLGLQALINIAVATVSIPTKGLSLPLVSAGGSGLVITCAALGVLYSVTRFEHEEEVTGADELRRVLEQASRPAHRPKVVTDALWRQFTVES
jgi:cell division protein FtsW